MSATEQGLGTWNQSIIQTLSPTIALIVIYCITGAMGQFSLSTRPKIFPEKDASSSRFLLLWTYVQA